MAYVNIPRDRDDPNYRYKMPKLLSKIEGRGKYIENTRSVTREKGETMPLVRETYLGINMI